MSNKILIAAAALTIVTATSFYAKHVSAHGFGGDNTNVVQQLSQKLGKSETEVQAVMDSIHEEHQAERQAQFETQLDKAVANGTITVEQKQLIIARHEEMRAEHDALFETRDEMTREEMHQLMQTKHDEMQTWAQENNIDLDALDFGPGGPRKGGRHGMFGGR